MHETAGFALYRKRDSRTDFWPCALVKKRSFVRNAALGTGGALIWKFSRSCSLPPMLIMSMCVKYAMSALSMYLCLAEIFVFVGNAMNNILTPPCTNIRHDTKMFFIYTEFL